MNDLLLTVGAEDVGKRIDTFLAEKVDGLTRSAAQNLLAEGAARLDGKTVRKNCRLSGGERITVTMPEPQSADILKEDIPLDIVYEDADMIVVNKPRGMVVHPAVGNWSGTLVNALMFHCGDSLSGINGMCRPGIVHRIDKDTSGLLVAAKTDAAHQSLSAQIAQHSARREYEAVVIGTPQTDSGTIDRPIARHPVDRKKMAIVQNGRPAVTHYQVLRRYPGYTHMAFRLETGRTHQIRVHMASIGHPIIGDPVYGRPKDRFAQIGGQCLHAARLMLTHPTSGARLFFTAPLPDYFTQILAKLETFH